MKLLGCAYSKINSDFNSLIFGQLRTFFSDAGKDGSSPHPQNNLPTTRVLIGCKVFLYFQTYFSSIQNGRSVDIENMEQRLCL